VFVQFRVKACGKPGDFQSDSIAATLSVPLQLFCRQVRKRFAPLGHATRERFGSFVEPSRDLRRNIPSQWPPSEGEIRPSERFSWGLSASASGQVQLTDPKRCDRFLSVRCLASRRQRRKGVKRGYNVSWKATQ
jgi:hypothetical protein